MTVHQGLLLAHLLLFGVWLGSDAATFLSSRFVMKEELPIPTRITIAKLMLLFDLGPRIALVLMLPLGLSLSDSSGLVSIPTAGIAAVWVLSLAWLASVLTIHFREGTPLAERLRTIDLGLRGAIVITLVASGAVSLGGDGPFRGDWLAIKVLLFGLIIACGIAIRFALRPFSESFGDLVANGSTPARELQLRTDLIRTYPWVFAIWTMVLVIGGLAVVKP